MLRLSAQMMTPQSPRDQRVPRGFSLTESLMAVTITAIAGSALLTTLASTVTTAHWSYRSATGHGLAQQLMAEISACQFTVDPVPPASSSNRRDYDEIQDYDGWTSRPPESREGTTLGTEGKFTWRGTWGFRPWNLRADTTHLDNYTREVSIELLDSDNETSVGLNVDSAEFCRVTVRVFYSDDQVERQQVARATQTFTRIPSGS